MGRKLRPETQDSAVQKEESLGSSWDLNVGSMSNLRMTGRGRLKEANLKCTNMKMCSISLTVKEIHIRGLALFVYYMCIYYAFIHLFTYKIYFIYKRIYIYMYAHKYRYLVSYPTGESIN